MMHSFEFQVRPATWHDDEAALGKVRRIVFIEEQKVPAAMEWDALDDQCRHVLALDDQHQPIGTGRLCGEGHIGRMAVLKPWRGHGVGRALLQQLIDIARQQGLQTLWLNAQVDAVDFYTAFGFQPEGDIFDDAGIPHIRMQASINTLAGR